MRGTCKPPVAHRQTFDPPPASCVCPRLGVMVMSSFFSFRFFLFSDQLVYAHQLFSGDWKMHEQLLLALVKVVDVKVRGNAFINSPPRRLSCLFWGRGTLAKREQSSSTFCTFQVTFQYTWAPVGIVGCLRCTLF